MADDTQNNTGVSNPPNGGQISDIANPEANDATVPQTAAPNQPDQSKPAQPAPAQAPQANQTQTPGQPQDQGQSQAQKQPDLSKPQGPATPVATPPSQNPAVQKASVFHDVAEALAGGPRYKYDIDAYGNTVKTKVPVSNAHLALAVAMEALSGAATGYANGQGPNGAAKALGASTAQAEQRVKEQDQQARQQATEEFAHRAQVTETNMRMYANARNIGRMDEEDTDKYLAQYKPLVDQIMKEYPGYNKGIVKYSDLAKYNVTSENAIPYARVPRLGSDGKQVNDAKGVPQWDIDYMIVDPKMKGTFQPTDEDKKNYKEIYGTDMPEMLGNTPMNLSMWLNKKSQLAGWSTAKNNFRDFENTTNEARGAQGGATETADLTKPGTLTAPTIKDEKIQGLSDSVANSVAPQVKDIVTPDNFTALIRGIINQESSGDPNAVSKTGATGLMQLTQATANQFGVTDRKDPVQNVKAGSQYFAQLLNQYKDPKLAAAAYYSGPGAVQNGKIVSTQMHSASDTTDYAQKLIDSVGAKTTTAVKSGDEFKLPDMGQFAKDHPTFPSAVDKLNASLAHTDGSYGAAFKDMESKGFGDDVSLIQNYLGSAKITQQHDDYVSSQAEQRKENIKSNEKLNYETGKKKAEEQGILDRNQTLIDSLVSGKNIDLSRIATMRAYDREIITNEVLKRNPDYSPASVDRAIKLADEAADESKTGSIGNSIATVNTSYGHMGEAAEHLRGLQQTEGRNFSDYTNKPMSWMDDHFGTNQEYQQWKVSLQAAATDWQNLLNNNHALTDHDKAVAATVANPNSTFGNAMASLKEMARTAAIRTLPLNQRWQQTMHTNYPNLIQPQTIDALKKINDPVTNNYLKDLETGGSLVNGDRGVGESGKRVGDLLGNGQQGQQPFKPVAGNPNQYKQISTDGKLGKGEDGKTYVIATGLPQ